MIAVSGAPRGSLYFHFPEGKDQLVGESVRRAGHAVGAAMEDLAASGASAAEFAEGVLRRLGDRLEESGWRKGCPVATVALEMAATSDALQRACHEVYTSWQAALRARLDDREDADDLAVTVLAMIEGRSCWPRRTAAGSRWTASPARSPLFSADTGPLRGGLFRGQKICRPIYLGVSWTRSSSARPDSSAAPSSPNCSAGDSGWRRPYGTTPSPPG
nr:hypothetical protein GCM10020093_022120 [Planobispora longispora]